jgi:hypothetical protein
MTSSGSNLEIVAKNSNPQRQHTSPQAWIIYAKEALPLRLVVVHDAENRPRVISREAA